MDVFDIIIRLFIGAVVLTLAVIPGIMYGTVLEVALNKLLFWPGFFLGVAAFVIYISENLASSPLRKTQIVSTVMGQLTNQKMVPVPNKIML